jgi:hypothetical protein
MFGNVDIMTLIEPRVYSASYDGIRHEVTGHRLVVYS